MYKKPKVTFAEKIEEKSLYVEDLMRTLNSKISDFIEKPHLVTEYLQTIYNFLIKAYV